MRCKACDSLLHDGLKIYRKGDGSDEDLCHSCLVQVQSVLPEDIELDLLKNMSSEYTDE